MTFEDFAKAFGLPKKYLTAPISKFNDIEDYFLFNDKEDYDKIKKERDEFLCWLKEFEERASEETYLEATIWLKEKMKEYYVEEAKRELNGLGS